MSTDHFRMFRLAPGPDWRALRAPDRGLLRELLLACDEDWSFPIRGDIAGGVASAASVQPEDRRWLRAVVDRLLAAGALEQVGDRVRVAEWVIDAAVSRPKRDRRTTLPRRSRDTSPTDLRQTSDRPPTDLRQTSRRSTRNDSTPDLQSRVEESRREERESRSAGAREAPPLPDPPDYVEPTALTRTPAAELRRAIAERYADAHLELTGAVWPAERFRTEREELAQLVEREAESRGIDPIVLLGAALKHFASDDWVRSKRPGIRYLVGNLHKHLPTRAETRRRTVREERNELLECIAKDYLASPAQRKGFRVQLRKLEADVVARADAGDTDPDVVSLASELRGRAAS